MLHPSSPDHDYDHASVLFQTAVGKLVAPYFGQAVEPYMGLGPCCGSSESYVELGSNLINCPQLNQRPHPQQRFLQLLLKIHGSVLCLRWEESDVEVSNIGHCWFGQNDFKLAKSDAADSDAGDILALQWMSEWFAIWGCTTSPILARDKPQMIGLRSRQDHRADSLGIRWGGGQWQWSPGSWSPNSTYLQLDFYLLFICCQQTKKTRHSRVIC